MTEIETLRADINAMRAALRILILQLDSTSARTLIPALRQQLSDMQGATLTIQASDESLDFITAQWDMIISERPLGHQPPPAGPLRG